jgi:hypothetical protein
VVPEAIRQNDGVWLRFDELGKLIDRDLKLLNSLGWEALVSMRQSRGDISSLDKLRHPARRLLQQYKHRGAPIILRTAPWTPKQCADSINRGLHNSAYDHVDFLRTEFTAMVNKAQWLILPYNAKAPSKSSYQSNGLRPPT